LSCVPGLSFWNAYQQHSTFNIQHRKKAMPIFGKTDLESLEVREVKTPIQVFKGDIKQGDRPGVNLKEKLRLHIDTPWLREKINYEKDSYHEEIPVFLAYSTPDNTFPNFNKAYSLSGLEIVCDGRNILKHCIKATTPKGDYRKVVEAKEEIPCAKFAQDGEEFPECPKGCKGMGMLYFYLQELQAIAPYQLASLTTVHSGEVFSIAKQLLNYYREFGSLSLSPFPWPETFGKIPFILTRLSAKRKAPNFTGSGNNKTRTGTMNTVADWPLTVVVEPMWYERFLLWQQYEQAKKRGAQLPQTLMHQLGFGDGIMLKSAATNDRALPPAQSEEEILRRRLMQQLGAKLKELKKSPIWAREIAFRLFGVTSPEGENLSTKLSTTQLQEYLEFLQKEEVEQYVETYTHNYQEQIQNVEAIEVEGFEEVEPEPDDF
jgi:hypothetical protein